VVLAVAVLLWPGRVVANTEGESSCFISYALVMVWIYPKFRWISWKA
jgi:hypothetical protein